MDRFEKALDAKGHRFLGYYQRWILGGDHAIYRCVCGYIEAVPFKGGPSIALSARFEPIKDARRMAAHIHLERAHQMN